MYMKKLLVILIALGFIIPLSAEAIDQRCWYEEECRKNVEDFFDIPVTESQKHFIRNETTRELCGGDQDSTKKHNIGFCRPGTATQTKISIGGRQEFDGIADFIAFFYKYGIGLAGIFAVIMIIVAGIQWMTSGGNTDAISKAQKRIQGSVIGIILLALSYTILYTINPNLVLLRPPDAWMINRLGVGASYCADLTNERVSDKPAFETGKAPKDDKIKKARYDLVKDWVSPTSTANIQPSPTANPAHCGYDYFVEKTGALTCTGVFCSKNSAGETQICYDSNLDGKNECAKGNIAGKIYNTSLLQDFFSDVGGLARSVAAEGWTWPWVGLDTDDDDAELELYLICDNGEEEAVSFDIVKDPNHSWNMKVDKKEAYYAISIDEDDLDDQISDCNGKYKGLVFAPDFNEAGDDDALEEHYIGKVVSDSEAKGAKVYAGYDLGNSSGNNVFSDTAEECMIQKADNKHFFSPEEVKEGFILDINMQYVHDIDDDDDAKKAYPYASSCF